MRHCRLRRTPILAWTLLAAADPAAAQTVLFVQSTATGTANGSSWPDAYTDLQDALDHAATIPPPDPVEIWVAAGVYKPDRGTGDRWATFDIPRNVSVIGGFAGEEDCLEERDIEANETILSGDLLGDDAPVLQSTSNCCNPHMGMGCDDQTCLEIVVAHDGDDSCTRRWDDYCAVVADRLCCHVCRPTRCENTHNLVTTLGVGAKPVLDGLTITAAEANSPDRTPYGGGLRSHDSSVIVRHCTFVDNAAVDGSGMYAFSGNPTVSHSTFIRNHSYGRSLGALTASQVAVSDTRFIENAGAGMIFGGNKLIERCEFTRNSWGMSVNGSPNILDCVFLENGPTTHGAGVRSRGFPGIINTRFLGNVATIAGGAVSSDGYGLIIVNSLFSGNIAYSPNTEQGAGGAVSHRWGTATVLNSTFVNNFARWFGGFAATSSTSVQNSIFWGNRDTGIAPGSSLQRAQFNCVFATPQLAYNSVEGWDGSLGGVGNVGLDPLFADALGPDGVAGTVDDDLRLSPDSPLINAGHPAPPLAARYDLDGHTRILCGRIDMGAYEFGLGDFNCDRTTDLTDFAAFPACQTGPVDAPLSTGCEAFDANADARIDLADFARLQRLLTAP